MRLYTFVGYLQIVVGLIAASLIWGRPLPDLVIKFGGTKAGGSRAAHVASEENAVRGFRAPALASSRRTSGHQILGFINVTLGVLCLFQTEPPGWARARQILVTDHRASFRLGIPISDVCEIDRYEC